jgi:hypothetical protein
VSQLNRHDFVEHLHTTFALNAATGGSLPVELVEVNAADLSPRLDTFSLIFRGPKAPLVPQGLYQLQHDRLGELSLYLVPVGPENDAAQSGGMQYEAVFNRIINGPS